MIDFTRKAGKKQPHNKAKALEMKQQPQRPRSRAAHPGNAQQHHTYPAQRHSLNQSALAHHHKNHLHGPHKLNHTDAFQQIFPEKSKTSLELDLSIFPSNKILKGKFLHDCVYPQLHKSKFYGGKA